MNWFKIRPFFSPLWNLCVPNPLDRLKAQCLKIPEKVVFNIASEASYIYILSGQKFIKTAKNGPFWRVFEDLMLAKNSVTRQVNFDRTKIDGKCKVEKFKWNNLGDFQIMCLSLREEITNFYLYILIWVYLERHFIPIKHYCNLSRQLSKVTTGKSFL